MGSGGGSQVIGYKYSLGMQFGFAHGPADALREIWIGDRLAWSGRCTGGRVVIHKPELFGGERREGGVSGFVDVAMGLPDQGFNDYLGDVQDFPTGAARGVLTATLRQMYLGMNPYLKEWELVFERVVTGHAGAPQWRPDLALIPGDPLLRDAAIYIAFDVSGSMDGAPMIALKAALAAFFEGMKPQVSPDWPSDIRLVGWGEAVRHSIEREVAESEDLDELIAWIEALPEAHPGEGTDYTAALSEADAFFNGANHADPHPYSAGFTGWGDRGELRALPPEGAGLGAQRTPFPSDAKPGKRRIAMILTDVQTDVSGAKPTVQAQIEAVGSLEVFGVIVGDGPSSALEGIDNTPGDGIARVTAGDADGLKSVLDTAAGLPDINAVHLLRELYTDPVWGLEVPEAEMGASWDAAAETAKAEGFGVSMRFGDRSRAEAIEDLEKHLGAVTYDDPLTGLAEIRLIRDDYDPAALPVLDASNVVEWGALSRRLRSEAVTSVTVTYRDRLSRTTEPRTATDIAAQAATGRTIPHRESYPGIRRGDLAARVAERDLRALGSELLSATVTVTAAAGRALHKGAPVILHSPRRNVDQVVCRVMEVERSGSALGGVRLDLVEDVFSFGYEPVIAASGGGAATGSVATGARGASPRVVQEASYRVLVRRAGEAEVDARLVDAPYLGALSVAASAPQGDAFDALVQVDAGGGFAEEGAVTLSPHWALLAPLSAAADDRAARIATDPEALDVEPGALALLGREWVTVEAVALADTEALGPHMVLTLGRGCDDTVPVPHRTGEALLLVDDDDLGGLYLQGETAAVRLLTRTGRGTLALSSAPEDEVTFDARAIRPYPPGRVQLGGAWAVAGPQVEPLALTWAHRDRTIQTTGVVEDFATGDIGPEPGVAYTVEEREVMPRADLFAPVDMFAAADFFAEGGEGRLVRALDLGTATSWDWSPDDAPDMFAAADIFEAEDFFGAVRPGALYSALRVASLRDGRRSWTVPEIRARRLLPPGDFAVEAIEGAARLTWRPREPGADALAVFQADAKFTASAPPEPVTTLAPGASAVEVEGGGWFAVGTVLDSRTALSEILSAGAGTVTVAPGLWTNTVAQVSGEEANANGFVYDEGPGLLPVAAAGHTITSAAPIFGAKAITLAGGFGSHIEIDAAGSWDLSADWTVEFSVRPASIAASSSSQLCGWWESVAGGRGWILRWDHSADELRFLYSVDGSATIYTGSPMSPVAGEIYHFTVVHDASAGAAGRVTVYVNGASVHVADLSGPIHQPPGAFRVGNYIGSSLGQPGEYDNIRLLDVAATPGAAVEWPVHGAARALASWWIHPQARVVGGRLCFGGVTESGAQYLYGFGADGNMTDRRILSAAYAQDDHNAPAVEVMGNGELFVAYTGHGEDNSVRYRTGPDPAGLGAEGALTGASTPAAYVQVFTWGAQVWVFTRRGSNANNWGLYRSGDNAATWAGGGAFQQLLLGSEGLGYADPDLTYLAIRQVSPGRLRVFATLHPRSFIGLRVFEIDMASGNVEVGGTAVGNVQTGAGLPLVMNAGGTPSAALPSILEADGTSDTVRLLDVSDDGGAILYAHFTETGSPAWDGEIRRALLTGVDPSTAAHWSHSVVAPTGDPFFAASAYFGGACFDRTAGADAVFTSEEVAGSWAIRRRVATGGGASWPISREVAASASAFLVRPISPVGASAAFPVTFQEVRAFPTYSSWEAGRIRLDL
ncbi:LamG-like jellyroll fold domain-containing protein [Rhodovulum sp. DZ06]|uniref:LamG-like jellyroll fold domain-containing protein n=1 Tax=Rhodovulum sp. DZ06 TaxID=3425126 RepID=UPI003D348A48